VYDETEDSVKDVFRRLSGSASAFDALVKWLTDNGYQYAFNPKNNNMEQSAITFMKTIDGSVPSGGFDIYDHTHIGVRMEFNALEKPPQKFCLTIQKPREILNAFSGLPPEVQKFIVQHHCKCAGCGYCTQRSRGKNKPFTICAEYDGKTYPFCPIQHVYTYRWTELNDELKNGITAYLDYLQNTIQAS
jgi:hypothetical protein